MRPVCHLTHGVSVGAIFERANNPMVLRKILGKILRKIYNRLSQQDVYKYSTTGKVIMITGVGDH